MKKKTGRIAAAVVFIFAIFVHLYRLGEIPFGINVDEIGMGYDAFCLGNYGIDRYFSPLPVYLTNYGGGQSALYAYLDILPIKVLGFNVIAIRLVGVVMYAIAIFFGYRTYFLRTRSTQEVAFGDNFYACKAVFYLFLTAVLPVYIMLFRIGMDCNLMLAVSTVFFFFIIKASLTEKICDYIIAGVVGGLVLYTYAVSYIVMPVFVVCYLIHMIRNRGIRFKHVLAFGIPMAVLAFPLILVQIVNMFDLEQFKLGIFTITKLSNYRSGEISIKNISLTSALTTVKSIFSYDILRYNSIPAFGTIYYISIPFAIVGFAKSIRAAIDAFRDKLFCREYLYLCWFLIVFLTGCCTVANTNKMNAAFLSVTYFIVEGVFLTVSWLEGKYLKKMKRVYIMGVIAAVYSVCAAVFFVYYFGGQYKADYDNMEFFSYSFKEPLAFVMNDSELSEKVTYMGAHEQTYPYFLEATQMSPYTYQEVMGTGKYRFSMPEHIDYEANYIVSNTDVTAKEQLETLDFEAYVFDNYTVYSYDLSLYNYMDAHITWNSGVADDGVILQSAIQEIDGKNMFVLVGWSYNEENHALWDDVYIKSCNEAFFAEKVERTDLADIVGEEELLNCGIWFIIPADKLENSAEAVVTCMDKADKVIGIKRLRMED